MNKGTEPLLNCSNGTFNFADVTVGGNDVEIDVREIVFDTVEFGVAVNAGEDEASGGVRIANSAELFDDGWTRTVWDRGASSELEITGDGVQKA